MSRIPVLLSVIYAILTITVNASRRSRGLIDDPVLFAGNEYDYIIVGGGTAGLTLAARLTENLNINVGVIEAGQFFPDEPLINTPFLLGRTLGNASFDWSYLTTPQEALDGRSILSSRGKVLGGSSALNFMVYGRASKEEYDAWESLGNPGWAWNDLLPYFKKAETVIPGQAGIFPGTSGPPGTDTTFEGQNGPLVLSYNTNATFTTELLAPYVQSLRDIGVRANPDPDSGNATGVFQTLRSVDPFTGKRVYATAYFVLSQHRPNLLVLTGAQATSIKFSKNIDGMFTADRVEFSSNGKVYSVNATKEVILSAGAFNSPQLLELSGIGNHTLLSSLGIPTLIDLPGVGENLMDHMLLQQDFLLKDPAPVTWDIIRNNATVNAQQETQYATKHDGIFASTNAAFAFNPLQDFVDPTVFANMLAELETEISLKTKTPLQKAQYEIQKRLLVEGAVGQMELALTPEGGVATIPPLPGRSYMTITSFISRPFSRGFSHINTTDPLVSPVINPRYLDFNFDAQVMVLGSKTARRVSETYPLASLVESPSTPSSNVTTDSGFDSFIRESSSTVFHGTGTAALAPRELGGVVDEQLRVYGTYNLRVIDASVVPLLMACHTQSTVYAIAEKAADMIKAGL